MKRFTAVLALLLAVGVSAPVFAGSTDAAKPELKTTTLDGKVFDLAKHRGHYVVVNFWATWCHPCIQEMPDISHFVATHKNVDAIGLAYESASVDDIKTFLKKHPVSYPIARVDVVHPPADFAEPRGLPTTYVIAPDGSIAKKFVGPIKIADLKQAIDAH